MSDLEFDVDELVRQLNVPKNLVLEFFVAFARFEYALKGTGFVKDPPKPTDASWDKFIKWLEGLRPSELDGALSAGAYLMDAPPKNLVIIDGAGSWEPAGKDGQSPIRFLLIGLCRARNNLFHGGKWLTPEGLGDRNHRVVETALQVLQQLLRIPSASALRRVFED